MSAASYRSSSYDARASRGGRAASWALALGIAAAIILALLGMSGYQRHEPGDGRRLSTFNVTPLGSSETSKRSVQRTRAAAPTAAAPEPRPVTEPREAPIVPPPPVTLHLPGVIMLSQADYAASNIGKIKNEPKPVQPKRAQQLVQNDGDDAPVAGRSTTGEAIYKAEWYREPKTAEMASYIDLNIVGFGTIVCRTVERFHVEDCNEVDETPHSHLARGMRQAAWQFLVIPPKKDGKYLIGSLIYITWTTKMISSR